jgi:hypothetical protein
MGLCAMNDTCIVAHVLVIQNRVRPNLMSVVLGLAAMLALAGALRAGDIYVPNYSFALPDIGTNSPYAEPELESWGESPQPDWYEPAEFGNSPWSYLVGTFYNLPNFTNSMGTNNSYIDNCDGVQAAFLFAVPQVAINQPLDAIYNVGQSYTLTAGLIGGGGDMPIGSTLQLGLTYFDASNNVETAAALTVTNTLGNFPSQDHFVDFGLQLPTVQATDPWAGKSIGLQFLATPNFDDPSQWGGFWDIDKVRLVLGVDVPNYSFESPDIGTNSPYAAPVLDSWLESTQADWYNPSEFGGSPWSDLVGTFYNLPDFTNAMGTNDTYIENGDGVQAAFLFAVPDVALYQVLGAAYAPGTTYTLTAGLIGGGGSMTDGSTLQLSLFYLDASNNMDTVAAVTVTNTAANFPSDTRFVDFSVQVPAVQPADAWAGKNIGIQFLATPDFDNPAAWGGFWDVDNVRLVVPTPLSLLNPTVFDGQMRFTVQSEQGAVFQILATTDLSLTAANWTNLGTFTNTTGDSFILNPFPGLPQRFYKAKALP